MKTILSILLCASAFVSHATMTDDWRLKQLAPRADIARDPAVVRSAPVHELPVLSAREELLAAPISLGIEIAPFKSVDAWPQNFTAWLEPGCTNRWALQWSTNCTEWNTAAMVTTTNPVTLRLTGNPIYFRARFQ